VADARGSRAAPGGDPVSRALERAIEQDLTPDQLDAVKTWLVASAQRMAERA
jgi:hypothetical protein